MIDVNGFILPESVESLGKPSTITIYNYFEIPLSNGLKTYTKKVLDYVFYDNIASSLTQSQGVELKDKSIIYIFYNNIFKDITYNDLSYVSQNEFKKLSLEEIQSKGLWTIQKGSYASGQTRIVKGLIDFDFTPATNLTEQQKIFDEKAPSKFTINSIDEQLFGLDIDMYQVVVGLS